ncbi:MAG TPA: FxsA family protein [Pseudolabrys sp.]|nr:FxsA family protein [Pseudolabrys sp.]
MIVAKWLLLAVLALPVAELAVFILVASAIGFGLAVMLQLGFSLAGMLVLRFGGGTHVSRVRTAWGAGNLNTLQADGAGFFTLLAGILLLIPGFITDAVGVLLLVAPLRRILGTLFLRVMRAPSPRGDGVVDLKPEEWRQVPEERIADRREDHRR